MEDAEAEGEEIGRGGKGMKYERRASVPSLALTRWGRAEPLQR